MKNVDNQGKAWAAEQSPKISRVFNNEFMKFMTDASPIRTARKIHQENQREERRQRHMIQTSLNEQSGN